MTEYTDKETLNLRIQNKSATKQEWETVQNSFIPLMGEIIFYSDIKAVKIGDGNTLLKDLPFVADKPLTDSDIEDVFQRTLYK